MTKKYGLNKKKKLKNYQMEQEVSSDAVRIKSDVIIQTEVRKEHNSEHDGPNGNGTE